MDIDKVSQRVRWKPGNEPGIIIESHGDQFLPWTIVKDEIEEHLLPFVSRIPEGSMAITTSLGDKENFVVRIIDPQGNTIGSVWLGSDPYKNWAHDGLVRVGRSVHAGAPNGPEVWLVTERMKDGTYQVLERFE